MYSASGAAWRLHKMKDRSIPHDSHKVSFYRKGTINEGKGRGRGKVKSKVVQMHARPYVGFVTGEANAR